MILVNDKKTTSAYQCPWTKKVFDTKASYVEHLRRLRADRLLTIRYSTRDKMFNELINQYSFEKIIEWIETHPEFVFDTMFPNGVPNYPTCNISYEDRNKFWIKITHLRLTYRDKINNTHCCPRDGVTCWDSVESSDGRPRGYPGWTGRIEFYTSHKISKYSIAMARLGIHTSTGGVAVGLVGDNRYRYDVKLFESDWPGLTKLRFLAELKEDRNMLSIDYGRPFISFPV